MQTVAHRGSNRASTTCTCPLTEHEDSPCTAQELAKPQIYCIVLELRCTKVPLVSSPVYHMSRVLHGESPKRLAPPRNHVWYVPLMLSFLARPGLCRFLCVLHGESSKRLATPRNTKDQKHLQSTQLAQPTNLTDQALSSTERTARETHNTNIAAVHASPQQQPIIMRAAA